jgi:hypothetical protein
MRLAHAEFVAFGVAHHDPVVGIVGIVLLVSMLDRGVKLDQLADLCLYEFDSTREGQGFVAPGRVEVEVEAVLARVDFGRVLEVDRWPEARRVENSVLEGVRGTAAGAVVRVPGVSGAVGGAD